MPCTQTFAHLKLVGAVEETSNAMALDGIMFEGVTVRVRRPNDYNPAAAAALGPSVPNAALNLGAIGLQSGTGAGMVRLSALVSSLLCTYMLTAARGHGWQHGSLWIIVGAKASTSRAECNIYGACQYDKLGSPRWPQTLLCALLQACSIHHRFK